MVSVFSAAAVMLGVTAACIGARLGEAPGAEVARAQGTVRTVATESTVLPEDARNDDAAPEGGVDAAPATEAGSLIRKIRWDNGEFASNFQAVYSRPDATVGPDGRVIPAGARRYAPERLLCPAPLPVARRTSNVKLARVWSGRWADLSDCLVELWNTPSSVQSLGISVDGVYPPDASHTKNIGTINSPNLFNGDVPDPDPGQKHAPIVVLVADGCVLAICEARNSSNNFSQAVSVCYWDENVAAAAGDDPYDPHGELKWKLHRAGPIVQPGRRRGDGWMASGPWIPPGGMDAASGRLVDFFIAFTDYRNNPGSFGGQLFVMRCHRGSPYDKWTLDPAVLLYTDEPGGQLVAIPGETNYMHFHSAAVTFPGGGTDGRRMVVTLSVGDGWPNNRLVNIARDDFETYDDAPDSTSEPRAKNPTPGVFPPDTPTWNGWTTYEDREGQRSRIAFNRDSNGALMAQYLNSPPRVQSLADPNPFLGYTHPGGITPVFFTGGGTGFYGVGAVGTTGKDASDNLLLTYQYSTSSPTPIAGDLWSDRGIQPAYMFPTSDRSAFLAGGDESSAWLYRLAIADPAAKLRPVNVMGVPTNAAPGYNGSGICLNWLCLNGAVHLGQVGNDYAISDYLALVRPNSIGSWINEASPQALWYSSDGTHWGQMFAPNYTSGDRSMPSAFFRQMEGSTEVPRVFVGRGDSYGLWAIDKPTAETTVLARPLQISRGGPNAVRVYAEGNPPVASLERMTALSGHNTCAPVSRAQFGAPGEYQDVLPPPCEGPILRCKFVDASQMGTWKIGADVTLPYRPRVKARLWVYRMPATDSGNPNDFPVNAAAKVSVFAKAIKTGETVPDVRFYQGPFVGGTGDNPVPGAGQAQGTGWTPFSLDVLPDGASGPGTYCFAAKIVSSNYEFNRQDVLVAVDYVGYGDADGIVDLPARAMKYGGTSPAQDDKLDLRFNPAAPVDESGPAIAPWTCYTAFTLPTAGPDPKTTDRAASPDINTLFTLWGAKKSYLRFVLDRENGAIWVIDSVGNSWPLFGPDPGDGGVPFAQPLFFGRGSQVLLGVSCYDAGGGKPGYRSWLSVGGTRIAVSTTQVLQAVSPCRIRMGDQNQQNPDAADYFGFYFEEGKARSEAEGRDALRSLSFLK